jgi:hypothetical protein
LDHAVYELSVEAAERDLTASERKTVCFPVCGSEKEWDAAERHALRFLSSGQKDRIRGWQPLVWTDPAAQRNHYLSMLRDLDNADKHRTLSLTVSAVELVGVGAPEGSVRFTKRLSSAGTVVARLPQHFAAEAVEPYWEVKVTIAEGGDVTNPVLLSINIDVVLNSAIRFVEPILIALAVQP